MSNAEITLITILCEHIKRLVNDEEVSREIEHWLTRVKDGNSLIQMTSFVSGNTFPRRRRDEI